MAKFNKKSSEDDRRSKKTQHDSSLKYIRSGKRRSSKNKSRFNPPIQTSVPEKPEKDTRTEEEK